MKPIDPNARQPYIKPMSKTNNTNPDENQNDHNQDPHATPADDLAQFADDDQVDLSNLGEQPEHIESDPIAELQTQLATAKDQAIRALAEAENTRKRSIKDRQDAGRFAVSSFARDMLEVADNLGRALDALDKNKIGDDAHIGGLIAGIEGTQKHLLKTFEKNNITQINPIDEPFDPNFHEVMFEAPMPDKRPGTIIQVMDVGYKIHDRLLRPARVGVVKDDGNAPTDPPDTEPGQNVDAEV